MNTYAVRYLLHYQRTPEGLPPDNAAEMTILVQARDMDAARKQARYVLLCRTFPSNVANDIIKWEREVVKL